MFVIVCVCVCIFTRWKAEGGPHITGNIVRLERGTVDDGCASIGAGDRTQPIATPCHAHKHQGTTTRLVLNTKKVN